MRDFAFYALSVLLLVMCLDGADNNKPATVGHLNAFFFMLIILLMLKR